jgi:hypothetical protein
VQIRETKDAIVSKMTLSDRNLKIFNALNGFRNILLISLLLLLSCENGEDPVPVSILTVEVSQAYLTDGTDAWIYVTNSKGDVLDIDSLQNGKTLMIETPNPPDAFMVTILRSKRLSSTDNFSFESYADISKGSKLILGSNEIITSQPPPFAGYADFAIKNYTESGQPQQFINFSNGFYSGTAINTTTNQYTGNTFTATVFLPETASDILISAYKSGDPVYSFIKGVKDADKLALDFNEFKKYENVIDLGAQGNSLGVITGFYKNRGPMGYIMGSSNLITDLSLPRKLGFLNGFDSYNTYLLSYRGTESIIYTKTGLPVALPFVWPSFSVQIKDKTPQKLSFETSNEYSSKSVSWFYQPAGLNISWTISGASGSDIRVYSFPEKLVSKYPVLDFNKLSFGGVSISGNKDGYTYEEMIKEKFSGELKGRTLTESWTYTKF